MKQVKRLMQLKHLFETGVLDYDEDFLIFDKGRAELVTKKLYSFSMDYGDIAWEYMAKLNLPAQDA